MLRNYFIIANRQTSYIITSCPEWLFWMGEINMRRIHGALFGAALTVGGLTTHAATVFDDFNVDLGHFTSAVVGGSGSSTNLAAGSASSRITTDSVDGPGGSNQLALVPTTAGNSMRLRHLSGGGSAGNNVAFTTSSGVDGWIGLYLKTSDPGFTVQIYLEGASNNGSIEKSVNADGAWHLYEWNLDDTTGGANGWGAIGGIIAGVAAVADGSHTIDSVIFRNAAFQSSTILMDFVAKSDSGSVAALVPEPGMLSLAAIGAMGLMTRRRKA